jgi:hypothetical protein
MEKDPCYCSEPLLSFGYRTRGIYINYLKRWRRFYPAGRMLILNFDDWITQPEDAYLRVCDFLGIRRASLNKYRAYNVNEHSFAPIDPCVRQELAEFFRPYNLTLSEYLGMGFDWR